MNSKDLVRAPSSDASDTAATAADVLREARRLIVEKGWTQGWFGRSARGRRVLRPASASCFCMVGAVIAAQGEKHFLNDEADRAAMKLLEAAIPAGGNEPDFWGADDWNDAPERTREEVLAAFDRAIALAEEQS